MQSLNRQTQELSRSSPPPFLGILCWEEQGCPRGLRQLEDLIGNSTNPATFPFPVQLLHVPGANLQTIVLSPEPHVLPAMIEAANLLIGQGARVITTSCGFNAILQRDLANTLSVPVFTSSLLQIPLIRAMLGEKSQIAVITANGAALTKLHFESVGVPNMKGIHIVGLEHNREWRKIFDSPEEDIDIDLFRDDLIELTRNFAIAQGVHAIVLECTDLPPFANDIRRATQLPVFDFVSLANYVQHAAVAAESWSAPECEGSEEELQRSGSVATL